VNEEYYIELLRQRFAGQKVILAHGPLAAMKPTLLLLQQLGAQKPLILAETKGTGSGMPDPGDADAFIVGTPSTDIMSAVRGYDQGLKNLPEDAARALKTWDPKREAIVIRSLFSTLTEVAGRAVYGKRLPQWVALEDKTIVDDFWDRCDVKRAPTKTVETNPTAIKAAAAELNRGDGTVWAADNKEGWHGGGTYTRWVTNDSTADDALEFFTPRSDKVRVMPFLEGIPCSIHGTVFPNAITTTYLPMEMVIMRKPRNAFFYCGTGNCWSPSEQDATIMRDVARRAGEQLRKEVGFRGSFTVDGVMTSDGFLPTELNPRYGAALAVLCKSVPRLPMYILDLAIAQGEPWDFRPSDLENMIRSGGTHNRKPRAGVLCQVKREDSKDLLLVETEQDYRLAANEEFPDAKLRWGPGPTGSYMDFELLRYTDGESVAPYVEKLTRFADRELGTSFGELHAPKQIR